MYQNTTGQVLGASTAFVGGIATLPNTGESILVAALSYFAIALGFTVVSSLIVTRLIKKLVA